MKLILKINHGEETEVEIKGKEVFLDGINIKPDFNEISPGIYHVLKKNLSYQLEIESEEKNGNFLINVNQTPYLISILDPLSILLEKLGMSIPKAKSIAILKAPMPGMILKIFVSQGDILPTGTPMLVLEAMKMENIIKSSEEVTVEEILVMAGQKVEKGQSLLVFKEFKF